MRDLFIAFTMNDNGGRRSGIERRRFSYAGHIPERRRGADRRCGIDRRCEENGQGNNQRRTIWLDDSPEIRRLAERRTFLLT